MKLDKDDDVILLDRQSTGECPNVTEGSKVTQLDGEPEVRSKPEGGSREATESSSRESDYKVSCSLFYLTKVRGISNTHNRSDLAIGIKGKNYMSS